VIPPEQNGDFVAAMETVLDVYKRPYDSDNPVICLDECPKQLIGETRLPTVMKKGSVQRYDYEYTRYGVCEIFMVNEPLMGKRMTFVRENKKKKDWAHVVKKVVAEYQHVNKITLVMDNLNTHKFGSLYDTFTAEVAKEIMDKIEIVYTPKHGSWLNMAEIELNVLNMQCLKRRIDNIEKISSETQAWTASRNNNSKPIDWQFTTSQARIKLKHLYPKIDE